MAGILNPRMSDITYTTIFHKNNDFDRMNKFHAVVFLRDYHNPLHFVCAHEHKTLMKITAHRGKSIK